MKSDRPRVACHPFLCWRFLGLQLRLRERHGLLHGVHGGWNGVGRAEDHRDEPEAEGDDRPRAAEHLAGQEHVGVEGNPGHHAENSDPELAEPLGLEEVEPQGEGHEGHQQTHDRGQGDDRNDGVRGLRDLAGDDEGEGEDHEHQIPHLHERGEDFGHGFDLFLQRVHCKLRWQSFLERLERQTTSLSALIPKPPCGSL